MRQEQREITLKTTGAGLYEFSRDARAFVTSAEMETGQLTAYCLRIRRPRSSFRRTPIRMCSATSSRSSAGSFRMAIRCSCTRWKDPTTCPHT